MLSVALGKGVAASRKVAASDGNLSSMTVKMVQAAGRCGGEQIHRTTTAMRQATSNPWKRPSKSSESQQHLTMVAEYLSPSKDGEGEDPGVELFLSSCPGESKRACKQGRGNTGPYIHNTSIILRYATFFSQFRIFKCHLQSEQAEGMI
ncbi:hypothetical protein Taro_052037 [Colocasia esculenta]|uniref:Uncharacterized protein n=1 Tax=Colocasia esculenta TaxID=4460 RepID=A0A843XJ14_COLES|nr:hypothetical protein [Colocasia esculenta]